MQRVVDLRETGTGWCIGGTQCIILMRKIAIHSKAYIVPFPLPNYSAPYHFLECSSLEPFKKSHKEGSNDISNDIVKRLGSYRMQNPY